MFVDEDQIEGVFAAESIIDVVVGGGQVAWGQIESYGDQFAFNGRAVHDLKFSASFLLGDRVCARSHRLFANDAQLHHFDFDAYQDKGDFAEDAVFEVESRVRKLELYMQTLFDANLHFDWHLFVFLFTDILHQKLLLLGYSIVVAIDDYVYEVSETHHNAIVTFKLLFYSVKRKVVRHVVFELPGRFQISDQLQEDRVLILIVQVFNVADQLNANPQMVQLFAFVQIYHHLALYVFAVTKDGCFVCAPRSIFYGHVFATLHLLQLHINFAGRAHSK